MKYLQNLLLLLLPLASSCATFDSRSPTDRSFEAIVLKKTVDNESRQVNYDLRAGSGGAPSINRVSTRALDVARLGIFARSLDKQVSQEHGLTAWRGVYVEHLTSDSAAKSAGIVIGDVLLSLDAIELTSVDQFMEVVASALAPGRIAKARVLRRAPDETWSELTLEMTPKAKKIDETTTDSFSLEAPSKITRWTGLEIATVPANLSRELWDKDASAALVTGVVNGSAGYNGGIRAGDIVKSCNGQPVHEAASILAAIDAGAKKLELEVDGALGPHRATISATSDSESRSRFHIPIIVTHSSGVDHSQTSFLDFIFQFGFNVRRTVLSSTTRATNEVSSLSILPFGMFEFERSPSMNTNRIFWFITWSTNH